MKNLLFLTLLCVALLSCKKENNDPENFVTEGNQIKSMEDPDDTYAYTWLNGRISKIQMNGVLTGNVYFNVTNSYLIQTSDLNNNIDTIGKVNVVGDLQEVYYHNGSIFDTIKLFYDANRLVTMAQSIAVDTDYVTPTNTTRKKLIVTYTIVGGLPIGYTYTSTSSVDPSGSGSYQYTDTIDQVGIYNVLEFGNIANSLSSGGAFLKMTQWGSYLGYLGKQLPKLPKSDGQSTYTYALLNNKPSQVIQHIGSSPITRSFHY